MPTATISIRDIRLFLAAAAPVLTTMTTQTIHINTYSALAAAAAAVVHMKVTMMILPSRSAPMAPAVLLVQVLADQRMVMG